MWINELGVKLQHIPGDALGFPSLWMLEQPSHIRTSLETDASRMRQCMAENQQQTNQEKNTSIVGQQLH